MRAWNPDPEGISGPEFAVLVKYDCIDRAIANLGHERLARVFNGVRSAFPALTAEEAADVVYIAVEELRARAKSYRPHRSLSHHLFGLAYHNALVAARS